MTFKEYKGLDLTETGNVVLERWKKIHAFEKSLSVREGAPEFIFFEGPPSANGMPGIHHVTKPKPGTRCAAGPDGIRTVFR